MVEIVNVAPFEAVGIAMQLLYDTRYGQRTVADTIGLLAPPINAGQHFVFAHEDMPVGFVTWAHMSQEAVDKYLKWDGFIDAEDWISGDQVWIMAVYVAPHHLLPCIRITRNILRTKFIQNDWQPVIRWVRDKPGRGVELRGIRYA